jgi:hypothetical protein
MTTRIEQPCCDIVLFSTGDMGGAPMPLLICVHLWQRYFTLRAKPALSIFAPSIATVHGVACHLQSGVSVFG